MKPFPLPLRVAAGLAVTTAERARELPRQLTGFPVTVASQLLQLSMRVQQHITELAIKGDDALGGLRPVEDTPSWATFDEDTGPDEAAVQDTFEHVGLRRQTADETDAQLPRPRSASNGDRPTIEPEPDVVTGPWAPRHRAIPSEPDEDEPDTSDQSTTQGSAGATSTAPEAAPAGLANYDQLTLPQLRARLRRLSRDQLDELLAYEREHANRASFVGMLERRINNVDRAAQDNGDEQRPSSR